MNKPFTIDVHTHLLPPDIPRFKDKFGYGGFIQLEHNHATCRARMLKDDGQFFREIESNCWSPEKRLEDCLRDDVQVQVLSTVPVMFSYWAKPKDGLEVAKHLNDHLAQVVQKHPKRFVGLGTVPLQDPELAAKELDRCVRELGLAGVQIGSHINQWNLNDEALRPFFATAEKLSAAVFVHPWDMMGQEKMPKYWLPWLVGMPAESSLAICSLIFGGVLDRYPKLRFLIAHGGGSFPFTLGRIEHGYNERPDLCAIDHAKNPRDYLGKFFVDSLVHDERSLRFLLDLFGENQIMLGSDYPFPLGERVPGKLIKNMSGLSPETKNKLLSQNALKWLGKKQQDFV